MRKSLSLIAIVAAAVLGWGYWHLSSHAHIYVSITDIALKTDKQAYGRVINADIEFLNDGGTILARGRAAEPLGTISVLHPEVGDCKSEEHQSASNDQTRTAWQRCYETISRWLITWVEDVRYANIMLGTCRINRAPVSTRKNQESLWAWWVPLPHVGGAPYTYFDLSMKIDSVNCRANGPM